MDHFLSGAPTAHYRNGHLSGQFREKVFKRQYLDVIEPLTPRTQEDHNPSRYLPSAFGEGANPLQIARIDLPRA